MLTAWIIAASVSLVWFLIIYPILSWKLRRLRG